MRWGLTLTIELHGYFSGSGHVKLPNNNPSSELHYYQIRELSYDIGQHYRGLSLCSQSQSSTHSIPEPFPLESTRCQFITISFRSQRVPVQINHCIMCIIFAWLAEQVMVRRQKKSLIGHAKADSERIFFSNFLSWKSIGLEPSRHQTPGWGRQAVLLSVVHGTGRWSRAPKGQEMDVQ